MKDEEPSVAVTPVGAPLRLSETVESKPPETATVTVELPLLPCTTETAAGDVETLNVGVVEAGANALIKAACGLPQPVTRS